MDISNIKIGTNSYTIKDTTARTTATNANTKIDGAKISGLYTQQTETIEIKLELGEV